MVERRHQKENRPPEKSVKKDRMEKGRERKCLVTGDVFPIHRLIRFVLDPDGNVVPDVAGKLPGRGGWVLADGKTLQSAMKKKIFVRFGHRVLALANQKPARRSGLKTGSLAGDLDTLDQQDPEDVKDKTKVVKVDDNLPDLVEQLLRQRCLDYLGLVNRAGLLVAGFEKVRAALKTGKCQALIMAEDAADNGRSKLCSGMGNVLDKLRVIDMFSREQLGQALGLSNAVHVALMPGGVTVSFLKEFCRYEGLVNR